MTVSTLPSMLAALMGNQSTPSFLAGLFATATHSDCPDPVVYLNDQLAPFNVLASQVRYITTRVYCKTGVSAKWKQADAAEESVQSVIHLIEDLLCSAMLGKDELLSGQRQGTLAYQHL